MGTKADIDKRVADLKRDYTVVIVIHNTQGLAHVSDYTACMYLGCLIGSAPPPGY